VKLTAARLRERLHYDPKTGVFTRRWSRKGFKAGSVSGGKLSDGHIGVTVDGRQYYAHRLAWLWMTGEWPDPETDHKDGDAPDGTVTLVAIDRNRWSRSVGTGGHDR
jgi:hypothetical protein